MKIENIASMGLKALQGQQGISAALGSLNGMGGVAGLAGQGFSKLLEKVENKLSDKLGNSSDPEQLNTLQALSGFQYFDADQNGQVTKEEIATGLKKLDDAGLSGNKAYAGIHKMGERLLQNYDKAAALDGNTSTLSYRDLGQLANKDHKVATLSTDDWQALNA